MENKSKKQVVVDLLGPYFRNPEICGYENEDCKYLTTDGRKCVAGSAMTDEFLEQGPSGNIGCLLLDYGQDIFKPEYKNVLTFDEWEQLQYIHDWLAMKGKDAALLEDAFLHNLGITEKDLQNG